jgi:hypothetical protein
MENYPKNPLEFVKYMQEHMPQVKTTPTGYEIRTQILAMAQEQAVNNYHFELGNLKMKGTVDEGTNVHSVDLPKIPGSEEVLKIAEQYLLFVNKKG